MVGEFLEKVLLELSLQRFEHDEALKLYTFSLGSKKIELREEETGYTLWTRVRPIRSKGLEDLYILLMKGNYMGVGTGGAALGLDASEKVLTLSLYIPYEVRFGEFRDYLEDFVNYSAYWDDAVHNFEKLEA